jgi:hypothetical protein
MRFTRPAAITLIYGVTSFWSACLLFVVQPMVAKALLPTYGGSPAVWNVCMVFFQAVLLAGYLYAHVSVRWLGPRWQPLLHVAFLLIPLLVLPIAAPGWAAPTGAADHRWWLLAVLWVMVGLPFLMVSTTGPLLQRWYSFTNGPSAADPYFLYAAGNLGSFAALLAYPFIIEPGWPLDVQADIWAVAYVFFAVGVGLCAVALWRRRAVRVVDLVATSSTGGPRSAEAVGERPSWRSRLAWVVFAFVPSSLMLGVTLHLSTDVAAVPLLWVVPLALYLLSFVIAFGRTGRESALRPWLITLAGLLTLAMVVITFRAIAVPEELAVAVHLALFMALATACHVQLANQRPGASRLTEFFLWVSIGGLLGGIFNSLAAPVLFDRVIEYPLVMIVALLLVAASGVRPSRRVVRPGHVAILAAPSAVALLVLLLVRAATNGVAMQVAGAVLIGASIWLAVRHRLAFVLGVVPLLLALILPFQPAAETRRTFFGVLRVLEQEDRTTLMHGSTAHGWVSSDPAERGTAQAYYHPDGPAGAVMEACQARLACRDVAVVGLGVGTLAAYGREGDTYTFYEIDDAVVDLARHYPDFTYLRDSAAQVEVVRGDGRLSLAQARDGQFDVIMLDAFSSDAIPTHLMTTQALELYASKLKPGGLLALHISNRQLDLEPVAGNVAREAGLSALSWQDKETSPNEAPAHWVVMARSEQDLGWFGQSVWRAVRTNQTPAWTDDYSNIVQPWLDWQR